MCIEPEISTVESKTCTVTSFSTKLCWCNLVFPRKWGESVNESLFVSKSFVLSSTSIFAAAYYFFFGAKSPYRWLYERNLFSFVQGIDSAELFIHKQAKGVLSVGFLPWLLSRRWLQGTQGNHSSPVNKRARYHGGEPRGTLDGSGCA